MKNQSKEKAARTPKLYTSGDDLSKQWSVFFQCKNPDTGKMERVRISEGFSQYKTIQERKAYGNKLIESITIKLNAGWNPFYKEGVFYRVVKDLPVHESNLLSYHLDKVLSSIELELRGKSYQSYQSHLKGFTQWLIERKLDHVFVTDFTKEQAKEFINYLISDKKLRKKHAIAI